jgi:acyl carrier protein/NAD(P)-dependent dehydrogenase (short-subunit alcohol dehydrogenase family)
MVEIASGGRPAPAAVVTGVHTAEGRSVASWLARAGYRVCLLTTAEPWHGQGHLEPSALPGHDRLKHAAVSVDAFAFDAASLARAAERAQDLLGQVTALVHVALPAVGASAPSRHADVLDSAAFTSALAAQAGAFLALGLALLPEMFGTQTGTLCLLTSAAPSSAGLPAAPGGGALFGAALGAVRELAERTAGTALRSIALYTDGPRGSLSPPALAALEAQLGFEVMPGWIESGWFSSLSTPRVQGPIDLARLPRPHAAPAVSVARPAMPVEPAVGRDRLTLQLAHTFRAAFGLAPDVDVSHLGVGTVQRWDSLGHLKLMMEVEQALRVRLPADALALIRSFKDLENAVRANLPAR